MKNLIPSLADLLTTLLKYKYFGLVAGLVALATVTVKTMQEPDVYKATSILLVKTGREHAYRPEVGEDQRLYFGRDLVGVVRAEMRILSSRDLAEQLVRKFNPYAGEVEGTEAVDRFQENLSVDGFDETELIRVAMEHEDPVMAANAVNTLVDLFKDRHLEIFSGNAATEFLAERVETYHQLMTEAEDRLEVFKAEHPNLARDEQRRQVVPRQLQELSVERARIANQAAGLERMVSTLEEEMVSVPAEVPLYTETSTSPVAARDRLLELQLREQELLTAYTEQDRRVQSVREKIRMVEEFLREEEELNEQQKDVVGSNKVYEQLQQQLIVARAELHSHVAQLSVLDEHIAKIEAQLTEMATHEVELHRLERELKAHEATYLTYAAKVEENRLSEEMDKRRIVSISVIQNAFTPSQPIGPNRAANLGIGLFFSVILTLGFPLVVHALRRELSTPTEVERHLDVPVLATIDRKARSSALGNRGPSSVRRFLARAFWSPGRAPVN